MDSVFRSSDRGQLSLLVSLDMSVAFKIVVHLRHSYLRYYTLFIKNIYIGNKKQLLIYIC